MTPPHGCTGGPPRAFGHGTDDRSRRPHCLPARCHEPGGTPLLPLCGPADRPARQSGYAVHGDAPAAKRRTYAHQIATRLV
ncbi:hypothetical protein Scani_36820 [Streptomyces caniferus]|uniref:Uncharacterized protein n=1 Tax=Streptomyces caniferus TaxID=285557 RepID=A0A640S9C8_9ACTN|nr:hypothetical protein Scani_36820 [Streptomyces caniferus]